MDEALYSRQLYVLGRAAQERVQGSRVLVCGELNGLGSEIVKNVVLAGVRALTLCDDRPCCAKDLSANFFVTEDDVKNKVKRSTAILDGLKELNSHVEIDTCSSESLTFDDQGYGRFTVVVMVNGTEDEVKQVGMFCHDARPNAIYFIATAMYGLYGYAFSDFGPSFTVNDIDGEPVKQGIIVDVQNSSPESGGQAKCVVTTADDKHHGLSDGDLVKFRGVKGLEWMNEKGPFPVESMRVVNSSGKPVDGLAFKIPVAAESDASVAKYLGGGHFEQVKARTEIAFTGITGSLEDPRFVVNDWNDFSRPSKLHLYLRGLWAFEKQNRRMPRPGSVDDAKLVVELARTFTIRASVGQDEIKLDEKDVSDFEKLAMGASGHLNPIAAFLGGISAQEVLKACSGKFTPLQQWLHFSAVECLPDKLGANHTEFPSLEDLESHSPSSRYVGQAAVFGWDAQQKLGALKCFLVGAGALGCESLKNFAMMGVSCGPEGNLIVTDMDGIETSNLNRQFLFRPNHIGKMKSIVAAEMSGKMNPGFNVEAMQIKVAPDTENTFNDAFWGQLDLVINALDNVNARLYVDSKCLFHRKPLLESGTLGTKANTLPVIPDMTESYGSDPVQDDGGDDIPACTLHAYPNLIEHTLAWARDAVFEKYFNLDPLEGKTFLDALQGGSLDKYTKDLDRQTSTKLGRLRAARSTLVGIKSGDHPEKLFPYDVNIIAKGRTVDIYTCVWLARLRFEELFVNKVLHLLHVHPLDKTVDEAGTLFWSGKRRPPSPEYFNINDDLHIQFVTAATFLYCKIYGTDLPHDYTLNDQTKVVRGMLAKLPPIPEFCVDGSVVVPENDEQAKALKEAAAKQAEEETESVLEECDRELQTLKDSCQALCGNINLQPQVFDKDDDTNGHIQLIYTAACIRGRSYRIPTVDQLQAKRIVGRIIPAIATTTAMTTGAIALELYKLVNKKSIEAFRCHNINLAVNSYASFEPTPCTKKMFGKKRYVKENVEEKVFPVSIWSMITLRGNMTVQEIMDYFLDKYEFELMTISTNGDVSLYNDMFGQEDRLEVQISELYRTVTGTEPPHYIILNIDGDFEPDDDDDEDDEEEFVIPPCRIDWSA